MNVDDVDKHMENVTSTAPPDQPLVLCDHVRLAVRDYLTRLDGEEIANLYCMVLNEVERPLIETVLELCGHNQSKAAQMLGLSRSTLRKKIASYGPI
jgi:Fis family transcriptional regulator